MLLTLLTHIPYIGHTFIKAIKEKYTTHLDLVIKLKSKMTQRKPSASSWVEPLSLSPNFYFSSQRVSYKSGRSISPMR